MHGGPASTGSPMPGAAFENPIARTGEGRGEGVGGGTEGSAGSAGDGVTPCKSRIAGSAILAGAVAGAGPKAPGVIEPVGERGSASVVPSNPNSRRGRKRSPLRQGRDRMDAIVIGIDVSKDKLDVHVLPAEEAFAVARNGAGIEELAARLAALAPAVVAIEATGGFETIVAAGLAGAGLPVVVVNPAQIRAYAKAIKQRAKTDPIDAAVIAKFARATRPEVRPLPDEATRHGGAASADEAPAAPPPRLPGEGGKAGERRDLAPLEAAELGQLGQEGAGGDRPDAGHRDEEILFLAPQRRSAHLIADLLVELGKLGLEGLLHAGDASCHALVVDATPALAFGRHHLDDLAASRDEIGKLPRRLVRQRPDLGPCRAGELGDDGGVDRVGLRPLLDRLGIGPDLGRVDDHDRQTGSGKPRRDDGLEAAGRLDRDHR